MEANRKVVLYIAMSLDGYIADQNENLDFLSVVEKSNEDYGYAGFIKTVDTVILGRKTYDKVLGFGIPFPHSDKTTFVITRTSKPKTGNITFYSGNLKKLIEDMKKKNGKTIFVDGGAEIVNELMKLNLIEEFIISIIPVFLGEGISLFKNGRPETNLKLLSSKQFEKGLVQLHYQLADKK